jgi:hypothetical protein
VKKHNSPDGALYYVRESAAYLHEGPPSCCTYRVCYLHDLARTAFCRAASQTRMQSLIPRNCKCRLRYNPARLAVFSGGELYRAQGTCFNLLYLCPGKQALLSLSITFRPGLKLHFSLASSNVFWRVGRISRGNIQQVKTQDPSHSREAMRAPLHPRFTSDPPPVIEISTGDFMICDHESHAHCV